VYPEGATTPTASNLNYAASETVANRVIVPVSAAGAVLLYANQNTNVVVDVSGWYSQAGGTGNEYLALTAPSRVCDTRAGNPSNLSGSQAQCNGAGNIGDALTAGGTITIHVTDLVGVPAGASAVVLNVTAIHPTAQTHITVYTGPTRPVVSDLNPAASAVQANLVVATVSASGTVTIYNFAGTVNVAVDLAGYYTSVA